MQPQLRFQDLPSIKIPSGVGVLAPRWRETVPSQGLWTVLRGAETAGYAYICTVSVYIYIYIIYLTIWIYIIYSNVYIYIHMRACVCPSHLLYIYIYTYIYTHGYTYIHPCIHTLHYITLHYIYTYITNIICIHTHIYIYTCDPSLGNMSHAHNLPCVARP